MKAIKAKWLIVTADKVYENYGFLYDSECIIKVLPNREIEMMDNIEEIREADVAFPGFINAHMHQYSLLSRGFPTVGEVVDFQTFLDNYWWPYMENRISLKEVIATTEASAIELIRSGVTFVCDTLEAPYVEEGTLIEQGKILEKIGIRGIVSLESSQRINDENGLRCLEENARTCDYFKEHSGYVQGAICTHTTFSCDDEFIHKAVMLAKERNARLQFHMSESKFERETAAANGKDKPTKIYEKQGALSEYTLASQCVKVDEEEISILKKNKVNVVHMPISNCEVGGGIAPVPQMLAAGIPVALGTDGYVNDFFMVLRAAFLIHKANMETTTVMPAKEVFRMATEYGAQCVGLTQGGKLEEGCKPDFVLLDDKFLTPITKENIFDQIVVHGRSAYVHAVYVAGKEIYGDGIVKTVDEKTVQDRMRKVSEDFFRDVKEK